MDGGAATYSYNGDGKRVKKVTSAETTYTFYGPGGIISEFTTSNTIATATAAASNDRCLYHTADKLGSAVLVMNSGGTVLENNRTLPYGEAWLSSDNGATSTNDKKFTTYQRDQESGLDYAMNRYDSNVNGRFMSVDAGPPTFWKPKTLNRYVYTADDPINHTDKTGSLANLYCPASQQYCDDEEPPEPFEPGGDDDECSSLWTAGFEAHRACIEDLRSTSITATTQPANCYNETCMPDARRRALDALNNREDCRNLFGTAASRSAGFDPAEVLDSIINGGRFGHVEYVYHPPDKNGKNWDAETFGDGVIGKLPGLASRVTVRINSYSEPNLDYWNNGYATSNAETLLHELGHAFDLLKGAGGFSVKDHGDFDNVINQKCFQ
jgi:RHS repeat-associated protein